jgi:hypothetical protein
MSRDPEQGRLLRTWLDQQVLPASSDRVLAIDTEVDVPLINPWLPVTHPAR